MNEWDRRSASTRDVFTIEPFADGRQRIREVLVELLVELDVFVFVVNLLVFVWGYC